MEIRWGKIPFLLKAIFFTICLLIVALLSPISDVVAVISIIILFILFLLSFLHFVAITKKHIIIGYGIIFIIKKKETFDIEKATIGDDFKCLKYKFKNKHTYYLFVKKFEPDEAEIEIKDDTDYPKLFETIKKNAIITTETQTPCFNKIGGIPLLPLNFVWPEYKNDQETIIPCGVKTRPMSFLMQVNFADLKKFDSENILPCTGVLSIFYDNLTQPVGDNNHQLTGLKAYYFEDISSLVPTSKEFPQEEWDSDGEFYINERFFEFNKRYELPDSEEYELETGQEFPLFYDAYQASEYFIDVDEYHTKFLGYANSIQGPAKFMVKHYKGKEEMANYILLFQISSKYDSSTDFSIGDNGRLYAFISKEDLKNKNFDNIIFTIDFY